MSNKAHVLIEQGYKLIRDIDILSKNIEEMSNEPHAIFSLNKAIQERGLLKTELHILKVELREVI